MGIPDRRFSLQEQTIRNFVDLSARPRTQSEQNPSPDLFQLSNVPISKPPEPESRVSNAFKSIRKAVKIIIISGLKYLKPLAPFCLLAIYTLVGGGIFLALETGHDVAASSAKRESRRDFVEKLRQYLTYPATICNDSCAIDLPSRMWPEVEKMLGDYESSNGIDRDFTEQWHIWSALYYCTTIYTTIGYGNIACRTNAGKAVTIAYAVVGIPIMLSVMNFYGTILVNIITLFSTFFNRQLHRAGEVMGKIGSKLRDWLPSTGRSDETDSEKAPWTTKSDTASMEEGVAPDLTQRRKTRTSTTLPNRDVKEPSLLAALIATIGWLLLCGALYCIWEDWGYFDASYFVFISVSTIGFGDISPNPRFMIFSFALMVVGLSLLTMCIRVAQRTFELIYLRNLRKILQRYHDSRLKGATSEEANTAMKYSWKSKAAAKIMQSFLSKNQATAVLNQFLDETEKEGLEVPHALHDIDPHTGMVAIMTADEYEATYPPEIEEKIPEVSKLDLIPPEPQKETVSVSTDSSDLVEVRKKFRENFSQTYYIPPIPRKPQSTQTRKKLLKDEGVQAKTSMVNRPTEMEDPSEDDTSRREVGIQVHWLQALKDFYEYPTKEVFHNVYAEIPLPEY